MSLLKNMVKNAVSDGISKGIKDAVGNAVEKAVKPAAEKLAGEAAKHLDQAAGTVKEEAKEAGGAFAELKKAAENFSSQMTAAAKEAGMIEATEFAFRGDFDCFTDEWNSLLPGFPEWTVGGTDLKITSLDWTTCTDGSPYYAVSGNDFSDNVSKYLELLVKNGFVFDQASGSYSQVIGGTKYIVDALGVKDAQGSPAIGFAHESAD